MNLTEHLDEGLVSVILMIQAIGTIVGSKGERRMLRVIGRERGFR
jgi:hypothetical protein